MIDIDASQGNEGGLVLRVALVLSILTGKALRLKRIRARRFSPGLKPQHLRLIEIMARVSNAYVEGAAIGSQSLVFEPRQAARWDGTIDIDTPGSITLLLQALFLPLSFSGQVSQLRLVGVTHAPRSPSYECLAWHWLPALERAGYRADADLQLTGFPPRGGGIVHASIHPVAAVQPLQLLERGSLLRVTGLSAVACLDLSVAERQRLHVLSRLRRLDVPVSVVSGMVPAAVPGAFVVLLAEFEHSRQCFFALGELGKPAETVALEAADALLSCLDAGGAVDSHLANQLLLPLAFADGVSAISTSRISQHLLTAAELIARFLPSVVSVSGKVGEPGRIVVRGIGAPSPAVRAVPDEVTAPRVGRSLILPLPGRRAAAPLPMR